MSTESKATERLVNLCIALMATTIGMTKEGIRAAVAGYSATDDAAFERMFSRDKDVLRELGIPLLTQTRARGDEFVYRIDVDSYAMPPLDFSAAELGVLAAARRLWQDAGVDAQAGRALAKMRALGEGMDAFDLNLDLSLADPGAAFDPLCQAISTRARVSFAYLSLSTGAVARRTIEPWLLRARGRAWYVLGRDLMRGEARVFRLSRLASTVEIVEAVGSFDRPPSRDVDAVWERLAPVKTRHEARIRLAAGAGMVLRSKANAAEHGPDGWDCLRASFEDEDSLVGDLVRLGGRAVVLEPAGLRERVAALAHAAVELYASPGKRRTSKLAKPRADQAQAKQARKPIEAAPDRLARLVSIVAFLSSHGSVPLRDLAEHFGVSAGQIRQDVNLLWVTGLPGYGPNELLDFSGDDLDEELVTLIDPQTLDLPLRLAPAEAVLLVAALEALEAQAPAASVAVVVRTRHKLESALGGQAGLSDAVKIDLAVTARPDAADRAAEAIHEGRALRGVYVDATDHVSERFVDPLRVFTDGDNWLLAAWDREREAVRTFRLDRFTDIHAADEPALAHEDVSHGSGFSGEGAAVARVCFSPQVRWIAERLDVRDAEETPGGGLEGDLVVADPAWLAALSVAHAPHVCILSPRPIRELASVLARGIVDAYAAAER